MLKFILNMNKKIYLSIFIFLLSTAFLPSTSFEDNKEVNKESNLAGEDKNSEGEFNPKPASASVYNLGLKSYEQGDLQSAVTFFKRAVDLDPDFVDAYYNLGAIYKKQGNVTLAINSFQKAVDINPKDVEATYELASCYLLEKDYLKARKYFSSITSNFLKYNEVKRNLLTINQYLAQAAPENTNQPKPKDVQTNLETNLSPNKALQEQKITMQEEQNKNEAWDETRGQLLVNTLTKPGKEAFRNNYKVVTGDFNGPTGIARDSKNNIYIANFTKDTIEKITPGGQKEIFVEKVGIKGPVGLAIDENDNLYVANYSGDSITKITPLKDVSFLINKIIKPYYLLYDTSTKKLFVTVQGNDSLVEIDTLNISKQPITSK